MDGCMNDRDERDDRDEIGQGGEIHKTMKSVQDTLRRDDQKNARRCMGCDGRNGRDGRTGRALSSLSFISFISSFHSLSSQDTTEAPPSLTLTIPHPDNAGHQSRRNGTGTEVRLVQHWSISLFFFLFLSLFCGLSIFSFLSFDPMKQQQNYFDFNSRLHWSLSLFFFPFSFSLFSFP